VQEYFEDLHRLQRQSDWSYSSVHALAAKVCLLLLNHPLCNTLDVIELTSTGAPTNDGASDCTEGNDDGGSEVGHLNTSALVDALATGLRAEKDNNDTESDNNEANDSS
jgi:hypothetical protein